MGDTEPKRKEIYTYDAPWTTYSLSWCRATSQREQFRLAVGSFKEEYSNQISIIQLHRSDDRVGEFKHLSSFDHPYPATKIMWAPPSLAESSSNNQGLLAVTGDYLRLWSVGNDGTQPEMKALLNNNRNSDSCTPLTSFDWNDSDPNMIGTCSIDTTCTIWDVESKKPKRQLIAHDKEVYDISFARGKDVFGTVGADGSVRMFDLRSLEHSIILFESQDLSPLLRIAWNKQDPNYLAVIGTEKSSAIILDIRMPSMSVAELIGHQVRCQNSTNFLRPFPYTHTLSLRPSSETAQGPLNGIAWAPHSPSHVCTVSDDGQALIWDVTVKAKPIEDPILAYTAPAEVNQLQWCSSHEDWVGICYGSSVQILRV